MYNFFNHNLSGHKTFFMDLLAFMWCKTYLQFPNDKIYKFSLFSCSGVFLAILEKEKYYLAAWKKQWQVRNVSLAFKNGGLIEVFKKKKKRRRHWNKEKFVLLGVGRGGFHAPLHRVPHIACWFGPTDTTYAWSVIKYVY